MNNKPKFLHTSNFHILVRGFSIFIVMLLNVMIAHITIAATSHNASVLIIKFNPGYQPDIERFQQSYQLLEFAPLFLNKFESEKLASWYKARFATPTKLEHAKAIIAGNPNVNIVTKNTEFAVSSVDPVDTGNNQQFATFPLGEDESMTDNVNHKITYPRPPQKKIIVAVLDTGVDYTHEDLRNVMWVNEVERYGEDFVDDDNNGCIDDIYGCDMRGNVHDKLGYYPGLGGAFYRTEKYVYPDGMGHGTMVAGVIGAQHNNGTGIDGVSTNVKIMSVKFINQSNIANLADAALAIQYAVDNGAKIINNSYGKPKVDDDTFMILQDAIEYAHENGVLMIASAGNSGMNIDAEGLHNQSFFPAKFDHANLLTVSALDRNGLLWESSNFGATSVDVAAPGEAIWSTVPVGSKSLFRKYFSNSGYMQTDGTSIATPYVTGIAATVWAHYPNFSHIELKKFLLKSAVPQPALVDKITTGGVMNNQHIEDIINNLH